MLEHPNPIFKAIQHLLHMLQKGAGLIMGFMELTPIGYRYKEAGKLLTVSEPTVIRLIQAGKLERLQITENRFVVSRESLSAYMDAVRGGGDLRAYRYTPLHGRRSGAPEERKSLVAEVLSRFGLGNAG